jgi:hypothetical protein
LPPRLAEAVWAGDVNALCRLAPCRCCCHEHTFESCEARLWGGCRGQSTMTRAEEESWANHYARFHGMSWDAFYGYEKSA